MKDTDFIVERPGVQLVGTFEDGNPLFDVMCDRGLEGVVAKRRRTITLDR